MTEKLNRDRLRDKTLGSLFGVFIGDALGLPVETMGPVEIRMAFGYVDTFIQNKKHKFKSTARRAAGTISDDSQLSLAMMESLVRQRGYCLEAMQISHIEAMQGRWGQPVGWGGSTRYAVQRMIDKEVPTWSPLGAGNGPPMKIAPLAIYCVYKTLTTPHGKFTNSFNASLLKKCREVSFLTHGNPMCVVSAYCQARMIIRAIQDELPKTTKGISTLFIDDALYAEQHLESMVRWHDDKRLSGRLDAILNGTKNVTPMDMNTPDVSVLICSEQSSYVYNSYPLVAYCVAKYAPYRNFRYAVMETVNAGADADSNASMVGAIMGACLGFHNIPTDLVRGVKAHKMCFAQSRAFEQSL